MIETLELHVHGRRTRVLRCTGSGPGATIVLVHGLGLSADVWRPHLEPLAAFSEAVVAPDLPGFGASAGPWSGMDVSALAGWLLELGSVLRLKRPVWVGHSVAAQPVVHLAAHHPEAASAVVLASPTGDRGTLRWLGQLRDLGRTAFREPVWVVRTVARHYLTTLPSKTVGTWLRARRHDPLRDAPAVRCPALVAIGGEDPVVPSAYVQQLRSRLPDAEVAIIPGAAHGAALSHAGAFVRAVGAFLVRTRQAAGVES